MRRIRWLAASVILWLALQGSAAATNELRAVRLGVTPERTRLVLELSAPIATFQSVLEGDSVLVLRLPDVRRGGASPPAPQGRVRAVELVAESDASGRDVLGLRLPFTSRSRPSVFTLTDPDRLVVDLHDLSGEVPPRPPGARDAPSAGPPGGIGSSRRIVVVDAGHGGDDPGATGGELEEKAVTLDVARRVARELRDSDAAEVFLTRDDDRRIPLRKRMRFAEEKGADLFVSIHVNASKSRTASGAEVFFLSVGAATDEAASEAARLENEADPEYVVEEDASLEGIPFSVQLRQADTLRRSSRAAERVLETMGDRRLALVRGVKQAGFAVLKSFQVPSILVEVGFISSASDRRKLADPEHRQELAAAIAEGVRTYLQHDAPHRTLPPR